MSHGTYIHVPVEGQDLWLGILLILYIGLFVRFATSVYSSVLFFIAGTVVDCAVRNVFQYFSFLILFYPGYVSSIQLINDSFIVYFSTCSPSQVVYSTSRKCSSLSVRTC